jgi:hypothetical protein
MVRSAGKRGQIYFGERSHERLLIIHAVEIHYVSAPDVVAD